MNLKKIMISLVFALTILSVGAYAKTMEFTMGSTDVNIRDNKVTTSAVIETAPYTVNDRTMVPLRAIFEALGAEVLWDDASKTVTAIKGDITIRMTIGAESFFRNDESVALDSPATIIDSRTLVPVRAIAESFGSTVGWIAESKTVTITD